MRLGNRFKPSTPLTPCIDLSSKFLERNLFFPITSGLFFRAEGIVRRDLHSPVRAAVRFYSRKLGHLSARIPRVRCNEERRFVVVQQHLSFRVFNSLRSPVCANHYGVKMTNDEDYMSFLNKVNDESPVVLEGSRVAELKSQDENLHIPSHLRQAAQDKYYVSEVDGPFEPVALKITGVLPDGTTFASLVGYPEPDTADVQIMEVSEWDPHNQYHDIVNSVKLAAKMSEVRVYRIALDRVRFEYWLVGATDGVLLGVKALAIES
ncbi:unnamed protein product [Blumeria hordei]|uniref:Uncharacterized protein n=2 Tax=Blumeria hordei TaxID=2867405 RepID=A0A383US73_BLUHO|nr:hypothetical protein BGHDH14_bgh04195 [Blumeria hordei DH14]SZF02548.1 unnamed protein product [Blumeria hordei]